MLDNISPNKPFSLLVKPASADCNLRCEYCFYLDHMGFYAETKRPRMSEDVLETMIRSYMQTRQPQYSFGWQGGEPTLMGADFFRKAIALQKQYGRSGVTVGNGVQTNGVAITDELAKVFGENRFLAGVSLDGPPEIHDRYRVKVSNAGSHADVMRGIEKLKTHGVEFNILILVNNLNVKKPREIYQYMCDHGFLFQQYISCVETNENREVLPFSVQPGEWGEFLCELFDEWYQHDTRRVSIRLFDAILSMMVDGVPTVCHFGRDCRQYFVVEHNGDVYPCDFFVEKSLRLGNVQTDSWYALQQSPVYTAFGQKKCQWNELCDECDYLWLCGGDCLKHRFCNNNGTPTRMSHLCEGWKMFYEHTLPRFRTLAKQVVDEREQMQREAMRQRQAQQMGNARQQPAKAPGRNDPCTCGSGKKFKKCCGAR
jgi:uncharacterized protein